MSFKLLLFTYLIGGLTFIPLIAISAILLLYYGSNPAKTYESQESESRSSPGDEHVSAGALEGAASATFAVLRRYDFQAATTAFKDASNNAEKSENGTDVQTGEGVSVYQSVYRSVFDRSRNAANPLQEQDENSVQKVKAKSASKVFYIVLRHGHLMLYDSAVQFEVRHVISVAHYAVTLEDDITSNAADFLESDVFTRRTAIVLTPVDKQMGKKPYFLFGDVNIDKEDFYFALLSSATKPPIPRALEVESMIKLQSALHANSLSPEAKAIDALIGRVFLALHRTPFLEAFVRHKIETKMARIPKPAFIASIACHTLNLGDAAPILSNIRLKDINIDGEIVLGLDLKYAGGVNLTVAAAAKLDLGPRFKTRMVSLLLAVVLQRLQGKMLVKIKPPPSNRIWFCFESMPDMELKIEPVVSSRQITYAFVLRAIEARFREAFAEGLVKPNWDDVPFFATQNQTWRGGIWNNDGDQDAEDEADLGDIAAEQFPAPQRSNTAATMPTLSSATGADLDNLASIKRRSTANLASQADTARSQLGAEKTATSPTVRAPKSLRTPSFAAPSALVAVDDARADAVRANDATTPTRRRWIGRNAQAQPQKRDAAEEMRQVRDRHTLGRSAGSNEELVSDQQADLNDDLDTAQARRGSAYSTNDVNESATESGPAKSTTVPLSTGEQFEGRHLRGASTDSVINPQRKTVLATTAAATAAARQWTWNAVANRSKGQPLWNRNNAQQQGSQSNEDLPDELAKSQSQSNVRKVSLPAGPIGRGQPLPPPGKPLPGPSTKSFWNAAASGIGNLRKRQAPALPPRRSDVPATQTRQGMQPNQSPASISVPSLNSSAHDSDSAGQEGNQERDDEAPQQGEAEGEFGPWMANDNDDETNAPEQSTASHETEALDMPSIEALSEPLPAMPARKKVPPPLPKRRPTANTVAEDVSGDGVSTAPQTLTEEQQEADLPLIDLHTEEALEQEHSQNLRDELGDLEVKDHDDADLETVTPPELAADHESEKIHLPTEQETAAVARTVDLSDSDEPLTLEDDIQAISAPVDAEAETSGILDLAEDGMDSQEPEHMVSAETIEDLPETVSHQQPRMIKEPEGTDAQSIHEAHV